jgi:predicted nucleic-acid-binding Zn-ribbon protein
MTLEKCPRCSSGNMFEDDEIIACMNCHYNNIGAKKTLERLTGANLGGFQINEISENNHDQNFFLGDL